MRLLDEARTWLFPIYSSAFTPVWLRLLGARVGRRVEASTVLLIPKLTSINDESFLADDTLIGSYELGGGWLRVERTKIGKRAFVGNSGMTAPGRKVPKQSLVAVLSAAPRRKKAKAGSSWLGSPPVLLRRPAGSGDDSRTYDPPRRLRIARGLVECCRLLAVMTTLLLAGGCRPRHRVAARQPLSLALARLLAGPVLMVGGALAAGHHDRGEVGARRPDPEHRAPALELLRVAQRAGRHVRRGGGRALVRAGGDGHRSCSTCGCGRSAPGWAAACGARPTGCPSPTWCEMRDGVTVNKGCVVQTHLFHDRVLSMDRVTLRAGSTLGPNSVILPASTLGRHATVGPVSLVMRGESVPDKTRWMGNPIGPWVDDSRESTG